MYFLHYCLLLFFFFKAVLGVSTNLSDLFFRLLSNYMQVCSTSLHLVRSELPNDEALEHRTPTMCTQARASPWSWQHCLSLLICFLLGKDNFSIYFTKVSYLYQHSKGNV